MRVHDWFEYHAKARPDTPFLIQDGVVVSYRDAEIRANRWANAMIAAGLGRGDRIAYLSTNDLDMGVMFMACAKAGVAPVMLNYRLVPREWLWILKDADVSMCFVRGEDYVAAIDSIRADIDPSVAFVSVGPAAFDNWQRLEDFIGSAPPDAPRLELTKDDMLYLIYTSGTTGHPKGIMISHQNVIAHVEQVMSASVLSRSPGERHLVVTPLYHAAGVLRIMTVAINGGTVVLMEHFDPDLFLRTLTEQRIATANMVPAIIQTLLDMPQISEMDFSHLQVIHYGAAPISESVLRRALATFKCPLIQGYGLTESCGGIAYLNEVDHLKALNGRPELLRSTGRSVVLAEVRVVDGEGNPVPPGTVGEIAIRGPNVMKGYWRNPEKTAETIRDGWLYSGDAAYMDEEGYVFLQDRIKDMIVSGGTNIYPNEIESALMEHDDIRDVAVIAIPDEKWGEAALAICVTRSGNRIPAETLIEFCRDKLGGYKIPRYYDFIEELPRNASGKVLKRVLREPYWKDQSRAIA
ncbi:MULTISPECIES: long-chain-fatty-acid--CoA ligase [unclassified Chelatococcus]|uniref:long-chain-fatty-acid--CoA ligase n=1 Tax=unclassified Chelatococcus TaxID=2638111 RepID=UPI001BD18583|nr:MULTISPECIES: long-chain-fatty-acid--CoA ligase [unclassified Chelatococcus]MBS7699944.1 long-chain-fatty-acid--CoA ligase [Chelatococcus sp. YT9]MBX3558631.1 long-chain-fatty-acid--CoA ligase [Chelatococcus sp.]